MNILIIYASIHQGNTKQIAEEIGSVLEAKLKKVSEVNSEDIEQADIIGFGSGIYFTNFHRSIIELVEKLSRTNSKKCFLFSTSGIKVNNMVNRGHIKLKKKLQDKEFDILGEFNCLGYDNYGVLKVIGGINRARPNQRDKEQARKFAKSIKEKVY